VIDGVWEKTTGEKRFFYADFATELPSGDVISPKGVGSATLVTLVDSSGLDCTVPLLDYVTVVSAKLKIGLKAAGTDKMDYRVKVQAEMHTATTIFTKLYELRIRDSRRTF
jgi:hypothetical protein